MERPKDTDLIRDRLLPEMRKLYDITVSIYRQSKIVPVTKEKTDETGHINILRFENVPSSVMSKLYGVINEAEGKFSCGFALNYHLEKASEVIVNTFEIKKNTHDDLFDIASSEISPI